LGPIPNPQSPIPNPQSPKEIENISSNLIFLFKKQFLKKELNFNENGFK
jgi:hypothetical protein